MVAKLDNFNDNKIYFMQWDTVCEYIDVQASTFSAYSLPLVNLLTFQLSRQQFKIRYNQKLIQLMYILSNSTTSN